MPITEGLSALTTFIAAINGIVRLFWGLFLVWRSGASVLDMLRTFQAGMTDPAIRSCIIAAGGADLLTQLEQTGPDLTALAAEWDANAKQLKKIGYMAGIIAREQREHKEREAARTATVNTE